MINYSITARAVNPNLFEIDQAKTRINQAKAEGKQPDPKDVALVETVVTNYFATAQYTEVMTIEKFARHIADHGTTYSRADIMAILYMAVDCMREQLLEGKKIRLGELGDFSVALSSGSPDIYRGKLFDSIENLYLCAMNNQGLLALAQLILPSEILSNFEVVRVEKEASLIRIYLDESVKADYKENPEIESKGFCEAVTIRDFPIRDKGVDLIVRRRKWYDKQNNRYFSDSYELKAEGTRYSKEFAAFLKGVYGDDSYDLPFA